ncbi:DUF1905 domain-containing protein [candidate division WWE3 bacterium]|uniref:DUF1905 domain-containing protein n=1 Tax=candidate division WWE3 bacterium TaxID=2053526 RepID=A0A955LGH9_UNCKA|nr:DUF1905 domain-containing protein [candidate division WWE3 bacterium]
MTYRFDSEVWLYPGNAAWHFATVPQEVSEEIKNMHGHMSRGFGSIRVTVTIGVTTWQTSIFPDKKSGTYLLPLKAEVRKLEGLSVGDDITLNLEIPL